MTRRPPVTVTRVLAQCERCGRIGDTVLRADATHPAVCYPGSGCRNTDYGIPRPTVASAKRALAMAQRAAMAEMNAARRRAS